VIDLVKVVSSVEASIKLRGRSDSCRSVVLRGGFTRFQRDVNNEKIVFGHVTVAEKWRKDQSTNMGSISLLRCHLYLFTSAPFHKTRVK
ncbi:hypothetical protein V1477_002727, partial [Vespula maculifrons]